eukprot:CFRG6960T1
MSGVAPYLGSKISLISKSNIRYEGVLYTIDPEKAAVALSTVVSFGTEGRRGGVDEVPPSHEVYSYITFRGADIKDLHVVDTHLNYSGSTGSRSAGTGVGSAQGQNAGIQTAPQTNSSATQPSIPGQTTTSTNPNQPPALQQHQHQHQQPMQPGHYMQGGQGSYMHPQYGYETDPYGNPMGPPPGQQYYPGWGPNQGHGGPPPGPYMNYYPPHQGQYMQHQPPPPVMPYQMHGGEGVVAPPPPPSAMPEDLKDKKQEGDPARTSSPEPSPTPATVVDKNSAEKRSEDIKKMKSTDGKDRKKSPSASKSETVKVSEGKPESEVDAKKVVPTPTSAVSAGGKQITLASIVAKSSATNTSVPTGKKEVAESNFQAATNTSVNSTTASTNNNAGAPLTTEKSEDKKRSQPTSSQPSQQQHGSLLPTPAGQGGKGSENTNSGPLLGQSPNSNANTSNNLRGGYNSNATGPRRYSRGGRVGVGGAPSQSPAASMPEFDFQSANEKFHKEDIEKEFGAMQLSEGTSAAQMADDGNADEDDDEVYDSKKSFFDNLSSDIVDRHRENESGERTQRMSRSDERRMNVDTFGNEAAKYNPSYNSRGRGRGRGGGGYNGGYQRGNGGARGGRGGYSLSNGMPGRAPHQSNGYVGNNSFNSPTLNNTNGANNGYQHGYNQNPQVNKWQTTQQRTQQPARS